MIPRFNYSFSVRNALAALFAKETAGAPVYSRLFPAAVVHEISHARAGIVYALAALQLRNNAQIGVQPYTCSTVLVAIQRAGFIPVFIDINKTLTLDVDDLMVKVSDLDALIVTHTFGIPANISRIREIVGNLPVIEDCAHAFSCRYQGVQVGNFFDMAVFSFGNGKFPGFGSGGLLVVNNQQYTSAVGKQIRRLKPPSLLSELSFISRQFISSLLYSRVGYAIIHAMFSRRLADRNRQIDTRPGQEQPMYKIVRGWLRTDAAKTMAASVRQRHNALAIINAHNTTFNFLYNPDPDSTCFALVCLHKHRDDLFNHLVESGIGAGKHFQHAPVWASAFGYQQGACPTFDRLVKQIITIPCHNALTPTDLSTIHQSLTRYSELANRTEHLTAIS